MDHRGAAVGTGARHGRPLQLADQVAHLLLGEGLPSPNRAVTDQADQRPLGSGSGLLPRSHRPALGQPINDLDDSLADVTLSMDKIPPGITAQFSSSLLNVPPGGSESATLTLTPTSIPPGHYGAEIKGVSTVGGTQKVFYAHIEFDV